MGIRIGNTEYFCLRQRFLAKVNELLLKVLTLFIQSPGHSGRTGAPREPQGHRVPHKGSGYLSAEIVYGGRREWLRKGLKLVKENVETKYGSRWCKAISVIATNLFRGSMVFWFSNAQSTELIL